MHKNNGLLSKGLEWLTGDGYVRTRRGVSE